MKVKDLKKNIICHDKEIYIGKTINVRGVDMYLISITLEKDNRNVLWVMYEETPLCYEEKIENLSNRDEIINRINHKNKECIRNISEIMIQKQKIKFSSWSYERCDIEDEMYSKLYYFIKNGMITQQWDEVDLRNIRIIACEQRESEEFPVIDLTKKLDIVVKVHYYFEEIIINKSISMKIGENKKGKKFSFYDTAKKKNHIFYIDRMYNYDIWNELDSDLDYKLSERGYCKDQIEQIKEKYRNNLEEFCPKDKSFVMLEYETEDGEQLNFYSKEYLDEKRIENTSSVPIVMDESDEEVGNDEYKSKYEPIATQSSVSMMIFHSDREVGINGYKSRVCMIKPTEKDFDGIIDIELLSCYIEKPEEIITIN